MFVFSLYLLPVECDGISVKMAEVWWLRVLTNASGGDVLHFRKGRSWLCDM